MFQVMLDEVLTRLPDFSISGPIERFHDAGDVYAIRHLPITFTPGQRTTAPTAWEQRYGRGARSVDGHARVENFEEGGDQVFAVYAGGVGQPVGRGEDDGSEGRRG